MQNEISKEILQSCLETWLNGSTLEEAAAKFNIENSNLPKKLAVHAGLTVSNLKELRDYRIAKKCFILLMPKAKANGFIPTQSEIKEVVGSYGMIHSYVIKLFRESGFECQARKDSITFSPETLAIAKRLYVEGKSWKQILDILQLSAKQIRHLKIQLNYKKGLIKLSQQRSLYLKDEGLKIVNQIRQQLGRMPTFKEVSDKITYAYYKYARSILEAEGL